MLQVIQAPLVTVDLTPNIAVSLRNMVAAGVFDIRGGNATLHFNSEGKLVKIVKELSTSFASEAIDVV